MRYSVKHLAKYSNIMAQTKLFIESKRNFIRVDSKTSTNAGNDLLINNEPTEKVGLGLQKLQIISKNARINVKMRQILHFGRLPEEGEFGIHRLFPSADPSWV